MSIEKTTTEKMTFTIPFGFYAACSEVKIEKNKIETGFSVKFPLILRHEFKSSFPNAKYDPKNEAWEIRAESENRIDQWISLTKSVEAATRLKMDFENLTIAESLLDEDQNKLNRMIADMKKRQDQINSLKAKVFDRLHLLIDFDAINNAVKMMSSNHDFSTKKQFNQAQQELVKQKRILEGAGLRSAGLDKACEIEYPEREKVLLIHPEQFFSLTRIFTES